VNEVEHSEADAEVEAKKQVCRHILLTANTAVETSEGELNTEALL
jgi:hypothetical protein